jgi:hypothetical protein
MRKQRPFRPGQLELLEDRRVPSSLAHVPATAIQPPGVHAQVRHAWLRHWGINVHAPYVNVHVGHRVVVNAPFFYGSFPGYGGFGPVVIRVPGFYGVFP